jgi:TonB family protein
MHAAVVIAAQGERRRPVLRQWIRGFACVLVAVASCRAGDAAAQQAPVVRAATVAKGPRFMRGAVPIYPDLLRTSGVEGEVMVRARLRRDGRIDRRSVRIRATHEALGNAVRTVLPRWRHARADRRGRVVRYRIRYVLDGMTLVGLTPYGVQTVRRTARRSWELEIGWKPLPRDDAVSLDSARRAAVTATVAEYTAVVRERERARFEITAVEALRDGRVFVSGTLAQHPGTSPLPRGQRLDLVLTECVVTFTGSSVTRRECAGRDLRGGESCICADPYADVPKLQLTLVAPPPSETPIRIQPPLPPRRAGR